MKKALFRMVTLALAGMVLSGCRQSPNPNSLHVQEQAPEKTVLTLYMSIEASQTISANVYRDLIAAFNAQSQTIEVRVDGLPTGDGYNEALERRLDDGDGVDLFIVNADSVKRLNAKGYFYDLSAQPAFQRLNSAARQQATVNGLAYCIPSKMTAYGLYVNVALLREHGLAPPQNAGEFLTCCQALKQNGVTPISLNRWYAMTAFAMGRGLYPIYQSENAGEIVAALNDGSQKISEYMLEGFRFFADLVHSGYYGGELTVEQVDAIKANTSDWEDFAAGRTAFAVFPSGKEGDMEAQGMEFIQQGLPVLPGGTISLPSISSRLCVNAKGEHVEGALTVLDYLTTNNTEELAMGEKGLLPVFQGERPDVDSAVLALYTDATSPGQIPIEDMSLCFDYWGTVRTLCLDIIGGATPEEAAQKYDQIQLERVRANAP